MEIKKCPFCGGIGELTMDDKIEITEKAVRQRAGQETAFVNMLNDEMELLILSLGYRKEIDTAQLAIQRFINQLHIDEIIRVDSDLGKELLKEKEFVLKRYYGVDLGE